VLGAVSGQSRIHESLPATAPSQKELQDHALVIMKLRDCLGSKSLEFCSNADAAPSAPGAYILQIDLAETVLVSTARQPPTGLLPGRYFYCGSANGPGGLRSRLARHMRHGKSLHWHIDQLTERGTVTGIWIVRNGRECDLVAMLAALPMPIPGFGSSDCSCCLSHLLYLPSTFHSRSLDLTGATKSQIERAMQGHVLANVQLIGTYQKGDR
jgi:Uri superfamily endonuclease